MSIDNINCDQDIFNNGKTVAILTNIKPQILNLYCQIISEETNQKIDWHFAGGRAIVKALGNLTLIDNAMHYDFEPGLLKHLGGAKSQYGYHPEGHNHWSLQTDN